jgi:RND superfamily putative drug exporter
MITGVPFFREIGFAVTVGITLVAFVVSLLLVPAATALVGTLAWWPASVVRQRGRTHRPVPPVPVSAGISTGAGVDNRRG